MSLDDQYRLRCITQAKKIIKNQISYLELLDGIFPLCSCLAHEQVPGKCFRNAGGNVFSFKLSESKVSKFICISKIRKKLQFIQLKMVFQSSKNSIHKVWKRCCEMEEKNCSLTFFPVNLTGPRMSIKEVVLISKFRSRAQPQYSVPLTLGKPFIDLNDI